MYGILINSVMHQQWLTPDWEGCSGLVLVLMKVVASCVGQKIKFAFNFCITKPMSSKKSPTLQSLAAIFSSLISLHAADEDAMQIPVKRPELSL